MQIIVTHEGAASARVMQFSPAQMALAAVALLLFLLSISGAVYHFVFLKAAREGWPVVSQIVRLVVRDEIAQRDRVMRDNLDAMAQRVGEMQGKLLKLEAVGERAAAMAGLKAEDLRGIDRVPAPAAPASAAAARAGNSGGVYLPAEPPLVAAGGAVSAAALERALESFEARADWQADLWTLVESRLLEKRLRGMMVPSIAPVDTTVGSGFGFRLDPFTGRSALHTGLDFPADSGTQIMAAAGGVVVRAEPHAQYGLTVELDHGGGLLTRYAHASKTLVKVGDLVRRSQPIAEVGSSGRSTGPHLHFEVLVEGVPQDPARFLAQNAAPAAGSSRRR
ncbi:M23 family metallopeptidase [Rivibacter subsaxonicus]|uniref:Murein DD-endopeptidase MepM/ murein hydrolase activator NlpD n=1 Tax=Rivibacter subsaxonicus TaxID=457575 RepID=A0A4Q7VGT8_9BURK|nr:M23 family metallopeptidase [Rivibacter subsaxonicus]RZT95178.1 murein DD-endopeptidase MepM/ murein hydrolase activator NlpD [Rivibacter subsaxonicus]